jgi:hypothetical protein
MPVVGTCNIRNNPDLPREKVVKSADIAGSNAHIIGFQEIREDEDFMDVQEGLGDSFLLLNTNTSVPIAFNKHSFQLANPRHLPNGFNSYGSVVLHSMIPGVSPERYLSWVILEDHDERWDSPYAYMNTHWINKAWNGNEPDPEIEAQRKALWLDSWEQTQYQILRFRRAGLPVAIVGDFNKPVIEVFNRQMVWAVSEGIDKIGVIPPRGYRTDEVFDIGEVNNYETPSDHDLWTARIHNLLR